MVSSDSIDDPGWEPTRPLRLLNLASNWPIRNHAARSLQHAPKSTCRAWARAIREQGPPDLDGLLVEGALTGNEARVVVLWQGTSTHFPEAPSLSRTLDHPAMGTLVAEAVHATRYTVAGGTGEARQPEGPGRPHPLAEALGRSTLPDLAGNPASGLTAVFRRLDGQESSAGLSRGTGSARWQNRW